MIEDDTIKLLRECDAGIKMGVSSIDDVLDYVQNASFRESLTECKKKHEQLKKEILTLLKKYHDDGKNPNPIAKGMASVKTDLKLTMQESDQTIADLITDGCNMGIKSLSKYLNQYKAAEGQAKDIAKKLIRIEEDLLAQSRVFL